MFSLQACTLVTTNQVCVVILNIILEALVGGYPLIYSYDFIKSDVNGFICISKRILKLDSIKYVFGSFFSAHRIAQLFK